MRTAYRVLIEAAAAQHGLDADLVEAVVLCESSGCTDAFRFEPGFWSRYLKDNPEYQGQIPRRVASSYGLMQCMYPVARELGYTGKPEGLFVPEVGLEYGCRKLAQVLRWADGDVDKALQAYNGGRGSVGSTRTRAYASKVLVTLDKVRYA